jgi:hypothetical protein
MPRRSGRGSSSTTRTGLGSRSTGRRLLLRLQLRSTPLLLRQPATGPGRTASVPAHAVLRPGAASYGSDTSSSASAESPPHGVPGSVHPVLQLHQRVPAPTTACSASDPTGPDGASYDATHLQRDASAPPDLAQRSSAGAVTSYTAGAPALAAASGSGAVTPDFPKETKCIPICMPGSSFMHIVTYK